MSKVSAFTLGILFSFFSNFTSAQCPDAVSVHSNDKCIYLEWTTVPSPLPPNLIEGGETHDIQVGSGTGAIGDPIAYLKAGSPNCNGGTPEPLTGIIIIGDLSCNYVTGSAAAAPGLPVELTFFKGEKDNNTIVLKWETASEINNMGFEIQRSIDGVNWSSIDWIDGHGTTLESQSYQYRDKYPLGQLNYYRLKQIDEDDVFEFSNVISINLKSEYDTDFSVFPNPTNGQLFLKNIDLDTAESISLKNHIGETVAEFSTTESQFDLTHLSDGIYFLVVKKNREFTTKKVILQRMRS